MDVDVASDHDQDDTQSIATTASKVVEVEVKGVKKNDHLQRIGRGLKLAPLDFSTSRDSITKGSVSTAPPAAELLEQRRVPQDPMLVATHEQLKALEMEQAMADADRAERNKEAARVKKKSQLARRLLEHTRLTALHKRQEEESVRKAKARAFAEAMEAQAEAAIAQVTIRRRFLRYESTVHVTDPNIFLPKDEHQSYLANPDFDSSMASAIPSMRRAQSTRGTLVSNTGSSITHAESNNMVQGLRREMGTVRKILEELKPHVTTAAKGQTVRRLRALTRIEPDELLPEMMPAEDLLAATIPADDVDGKEKIQTILELRRSKSNALIAAQQGGTRPVSRQTDTSSCLSGYQKSIPPPPVDEAKLDALVAEKLAKLEQREQKEGLSVVKVHAGTVPHEDLQHGGLLYQADSEKNQKAQRALELALAREALLAEEEEEKKQKSSEELALESSAEVFLSAGISEQEQHELALHAQIERCRMALSLQHHQLLEYKGKLEELEKNQNEAEEATAKDTAAKSIESAHVRKQQEEEQEKEKANKALLEHKAAREDQQAAEEAAAAKAEAVRKEESLLKHDASTRIQAVYRGHQARSIEVPKQRDVIAAKRVIRAQEFAIEAQGMEAARRRLEEALREQQREGSLMQDLEAHQLTAELLAEEARLEESRRKRRIGQVEHRAAVSIQATWKMHTVQQWYESQREARHAAAKEQQEERRRFEAALTIQSLKYIRDAKKLQSRRQHLGSKYTPAGKDTNEVGMHYVAAVAIQSHWRRKQQQQLVQARLAEKKATLKAIQENEASEVIQQRAKVCLAKKEAERRREELQKAQVGTRAEGCQ